MARLSKDKRDKLILVTMGTVAIIAGLWYGVIKTRNEEFTLMQTRRAKTLEKLDKARSVVRRAVQAEADLRAATNLLRTAEETMAAGDSFSWGLQLLEKTKAGHDVSIIDVGRPVKGEVNMLAQFPYEATIFSVRGTAYYHDFGKFLADFENRYPYFRVQNLSLLAGSEDTSGTNSSTPGTGEAKLSFKMEIVALIKPNQ